MISSTRMTTLFGICTVDEMQKCRLQIKLKLNLAIGFKLDSL